MIETTDLQERARQRLADDIRRQQAMLDDVRQRTAEARGELAAVERTKLEQLEEDFDAQVAALDSWLRHSRAHYLTRLRNALPLLAAQGGEVPYLKPMVKAQPPEKGENMYSRAVNSDPRLQRLYYEQPGQLKPQADNNDWVATPEKMERARLKAEGKVSDPPVLPKQGLGYKPTPQEWARAVAKGRGEI
jgi:hypothetical protein